MASCRVCGSPKIIDMDEVLDEVKGSRVQYRQCPRCSSLQHDGRIRDEDLRNMDAYGDDVTFPRACLEKGQELFREAPLIRYMTPGSCFNLEVNDGYHASCWLQRGWEVYGCSLSRISSDRARALGVQSVVGSASQALESLGVTEFDAVMSDTGYCRYKHPMGELRRCISRLRPGGAILLKGPDPESNKILGEMTSGHLNEVNRTIPSPSAIREFFGEKDVAIVSYDDDDGEFRIIGVKFG